MKLHYICETAITTRLHGALLSLFLDYKVSEAWNDKNYNSVGYDALSQSKHSFSFLMCYHFSLV